MRPIIAASPTKNQPPPTKRKPILGQVTVVPNQTLVQNPILELRLKQSPIRVVRKSRLRKRTSVHPSSLLPANSDAATLPPNQAVSEFVGRGGFLVIVSFSRLEGSDLRVNVCG